MKLLKRFHDKSPVWFAVLWIILYCILMSVGDGLSARVGIEKSVTLPIGLVLSVLLFLYLKSNGILREYGLQPSKASPKAMLFYLPAVVMLSANLWHGVRLNYNPLETVLYFLSMLAVGFLEEVIFRGLLFNAMRPSSTKWAVIVSSLTFGVGHLVNLVNGSGAEILPSLLQVVYAACAGFMFVMMYLNEESLIPCIAFHGIFNGLSAFTYEGAATSEARLLTSILLAIITASYGAYLAFRLKKRGGAVS